MAHRKQAIALILSLMQALIYASDVPPNIPQAIVKAIQQGNDQAVAAYFDAHPQDINKPDHLGAPALRNAVTAGHPSVVRVLLNRSASIKDLWRCSLCTIQHTLLDPILTKAAICEKDWEIISLLLDAGMNINGHTPQEKVTPLMTATYSANPAIIHRLLVLGADPSVQGINFEPNHSAIQPLFLGNNTTPYQVAWLLLAHYNTQYNTLQKSMGDDQENMLVKKQMSLTKKKIEAYADTLAYYCVWGAHQTELKSCIQPLESLMPKELVRLISSYLTNEFPPLVKEISQEQAVAVTVKHHMKRIRSRTALLRTAKKTILAYCPPGCIT
jgi:hypothetical protein